MAPENRNSESRPGLVPSIAGRIPFFYGWVVVAVCFVAGILASGTMNIVTGVLLKPMTDDLRWSRSMFAAAVAAGTVGGGILSPLIGKLADRYGARILIGGGGAIIGCLLLGFSQMTDSWQLYAWYVPARMLAVNVLHGAVPVSAVAQWFRAMRPRAIGITGTSAILGGAIMALVSESLIRNFGWRSVPLVYGVATLIFLVGPALVLLVKTPEEIGLQPDGGSDKRSGGPGNAGGKDSIGEEESWTLQEAIGTRSFWLILISFFLATTASASIGFHQVAYFTDRGISAGAAAAALSVFAFSGAVANTVWGFMAERVSDRVLNVWARVVSAGLILFLMHVDSASSAYLFAALFGFTTRGQGALVNIILAHYYGRKSFGAISGFASPFQLAGIGLGPLVAAVVFDRTGSYDTAFELFMAMYLVASFLMFLARQPSPKGRS